MLLKLLQIFHVSWVTFRQITPKGHLENEKRLRREIANSNERRRMQSINAGFQVLRTLIPHGEGEKLSKVCHSKTRIGCKLPMEIYISLDKVYSHSLGRYLTGRN